MMQQTKQPAPADDALLDDQLEDGEDGVLPEFPTQPFRVTLPKGRSPIPARQSRLRVSQAVPVQPCQRTRRTEDHDDAAPTLPLRRDVLRRALSWSTRASAPHLFPLGVGMLVMLGVIVLWSMTVSGLQQLQLQWHYGDARVTQADINVGHGGTSHFVALYLDGQAIVMEFPKNGDATQMHLYAHRYYWHDAVHRLVQIKRTRISDRDALLVTTDGIELPFVLYNNSDGTYHVTP